ncbi:hypothetical protein AOP6_0221 [Desulfuromonas sp. AOP6]|nr:hypothetical protein AOP6_0221 [Desulfuromonas sp. AOP6]
MVHQLEVPILRFASGAAPGWQLSFNYLNLVILIGCDIMI